MNSIISVIKHKAISRTKKKKFNLTWNINFHFKFHSTHLIAALVTIIFQITHNFCIFSILKDYFEGIVTVAQLTPKSDICALATWRHYYQLSLFTISFFFPNHSVFHISTISLNQTINDSVLIVNFQLFQVEFHHRWVVEIQKTVKLAVKVST